MPLLAPLQPPGKGRGCIFFSKQSLNIWLDSIRKICLPKMLQKLRKCENRIPIKAPILLILPLNMPLLAPLQPPKKGRGCIFFSKQSLNIWLHSIRKIYLPKMLQKLRKCENRIPLKAPILPLYMPPWPPYTLRMEFFFL